MDAKIIETLVKDGYIPVLATVASSPTGESLNVNADIAAGEVRTLHIKTQLFYPIGQNPHRPCSAVLTTLLDACIVFA